MRGVRRRHIRSVFESRRQPSVHVVEQLLPECAPAGAEKRSSRSGKLQDSLQVLLFKLSRQPQAARIVLRGNHDGPHRREAKGVKRLPRSGAIIVGARFDRRAKEVVKRHDDERRL